MPNQGSGSANFWIDAQVTDTAPDGTSYRLWPGLPVPQTRSRTAPSTSRWQPSSICPRPARWTTSGSTRPRGQRSVQPPAGCRRSPRRPWWPGRRTLPRTGRRGPASGWVSCSYSGVTLAAGDYKVAVCNSAASPQMWNLATIDYWSTGAGGQGITTGPLSAPNRPRPPARARAHTSRGPHLPGPAPTTRAGPRATGWTWRSPIRRRYHRRRTGRQPRPVPGLLVTSRVSAGHSWPPRPSPLPRHRIPASRRPAAPRKSR